MAAKARTLTVALLGAESSGKSQLALALVEHLGTSGWRAQAVGEVLREWCEREGRTPRQDEQMAIALSQARRVEEAAGADGGIVIADTTPLMTAIYSELLFGDCSIYPMALGHQRRYDLTLVMGLDLPWVADGLQRDGAHVRGPVDAKIRAALGGAAIPYKVIHGSGPARLRNTLHAMQSIAINDQPTRGKGIFNAEKQVETGLTCARCGDPDCERWLFSRLL